ncbi:MAG: thioredoxin family protein [Cytophagia bacterium]|nr:thioredoxin family protein [Cytophagia bacterium]
MKNLILYTTLYNQNLFWCTTNYAFMKKITALFVLITLCSLVQAQTLSNFSLKNVVDAKQISLQDFASSSGLVIIFTSVACPFDGYYSNRLKQLQNEYSGKLPILLVNAYTEAPEAEEWMIKTAQANGLTLPYLSDKDQVLMTQLNAQRSPEAFVLKNTNGQFTVAYHGAIDDNAQAENGVKQNYLKDAMENLLNGKNIIQVSTRPVGCYIRKK